MHSVTIWWVPRCRKCCPADAEVPQVKQISPGTESHASIPSDISWSHQAQLSLWAYLGTDVSAASPLNHCNACAESGLLLCSRAQLQATILQRALCVCREFIVGMQLSITATAGLGSSSYSFKVIVVCFFFFQNNSINEAFIFYLHRRETI